MYNQIDSLNTMSINMFGVAREGSLSVASRVGIHVCL